MKKLKLSLLALLGATAIISCGGDGDSEDVLGTGNNGGGDDVTVPTIRITEGGADDDKFVDTAVGVAGETTKARVIFTTTDKKQRRLYVTKSEFGGSAEPFVIEELGKKGTKADGSIDLDDDTTKVLDFTFDLDVPADTNGEITYNFWSTTGKGDFRDATKRLLIGVGEITVKVGTGVNPNALVRSFSGVKLVAPASDGSTDSFFSLLDGVTHKIQEGNELRALWDFGYFYTNAKGASFASTQNYKSAFPFFTAGFEPTEQEIAEGETLNKFYFKKSTVLSSMDFDNITTSVELASITKPSTEEINSLAVNDIIEFEDSYGDKGLIRITEIVPGSAGNGTDFIVFDIKVQPSTAIKGGSQM